jgi:hypothetical protein
MLRRCHIVGFGLLLAACAPKRWPVDECAISDSESQASPPLADLSAAKPFRTYLAVTQVEPAGQHFTVWYSSVESTTLQLRVERAATGRLVITSEGGYWGGVGLPPDSVPPVPPEAAVLAHELEAELRRRCPVGRHWQLKYEGLSRTVTVQEFVARDDSRGTQRGGWFATAKVAADASLAHITSIVEETSGFGTIELPGTAQWLVPPPSLGDKLFLYHGGAMKLAEDIAAAARRFDSHEPGPALASLVPADAPMLPVGFVPQVTAKVHLSMRDYDNSNLIAELNLHDAVFGTGASGEATLPAGYKLHATLTPEAPRAPVAGRTSDRYAGTLLLQLEDGRGHRWERSYRATGGIELEGDTVVAPAGLSIPGASAPSPEEQARHGKLGGLDLTVDLSLLADPRR